MGFEKMVGFLYSTELFFIFIADFFFGNYYKLVGVSWINVAFIFNTFCVNVGAWIPVEVPLGSIWNPIQSKENNRTVMFYAGES